MLKQRRVMMLVVLFVVSTLVLFGCTSSNAGTDESESDFPQKDLTFLIGTSSGGSNDLAARALIPGAERFLGVKVVPEMLQGANGAVAAVKLGELEPDGYNLYMHSQSLIMMQYSGQPDVNMKKYQPIIQVAEDASSLAVPVDAPYDTLKEFIAYAKKNPGKVRVGTSGAGSIWHIAGVLLEKAADIDLEFIPYDKGGAQATAAAASGEVEAVTTSPGEQRALVEGGKLKILAVLSDQRHPLFPDVPTAQELGVDAVFPVWRGVFTTAGLSEDRLQVLHDALKAAMESDEFITFMETSGFPIRYRGTEDFSRFVEEQDEMYRSLLDELGLKVSEPR